MTIKEENSLCDDDWQLILITYCCVTIKEENSLCDDDWQLTLITYCLVHQQLLEQALD